MKTHTIKTPTSELLVVELPIGWDYEPITDDKTFIYHKTEEGTNDHHIEGYTLLGKPDEISEEDAMELVEPPIDKWGDDKFRFLDYRYDGCYDLFTAKESLLSLLDSEIFWDVNPIGKPRWDEIAPVEHWNDYQDAIDNWHISEQKTFDRNRTLIFVKN